MSKKAYWDGIYEKKPSDKVSWYQEKSSLSLEIIQSLRLEKEDVIIDVGGGASVWVDSVVEDKFQNITVLDVSSKALSIAKERLGKEASKVNWVVSDITEYKTTQTYRLWHDRAVFHFLTEEADRKVYRQQLERYVDLGGFVIIASFSMGGATQCSGLDTVQYDGVKLQAEVGDKFSLIKEASECHITPNGKAQLFSYFTFKRVK